MSRMLKVANESNHADEAFIITTGEQVEHLNPGQSMYVPLAWASEAHFEIEVRPVRTMSDQYVHSVDELMQALRASFAVLPMDIRTAIDRVREGQGLPLFSSPESELPGEEDGSDVSL